LFWCLCLKFQFLLNATKNEIFGQRTRRDLFKVGDNRTWATTEAVNLTNPTKIDVFVILYH
jgi:hypothetical protein